MYKGTRSGGAYGTSGKHYTWVKDQELNIPKDELNGAYGIEWVGPQTKKEIKAKLDDAGIEYDGRSKKEDLLKLLE